MNKAFTLRRSRYSQSFNLGVLASAVATATATEAAVLEEVVITAQKREQNLQDVGVSVTAYSGDQLRALGVTNTTEITEQIAGLQMTSFSPNLVTFNIRGVSQNNFTDNNEAPVAVYIDDAYVARFGGLARLHVPRLLLSLGGRF